MSGLPVVVLGFAGQQPFPGVAWQTLHYLEGLRRVGCDPFYLEDTGAWPYDPVSNAVTADSRFTVAYLHGILDRAGFDGRWAYRSAAEGGAVHGTDAAAVRSRLRASELLINLSGATVLSDEHREVPRRLYLETDPVAPQIEVATGNRFTIGLLDAHTHLATFAENIGAPDCPIPLSGRRYLPTRQPVVRDWWRPDGPPNGRPFTTVSNWRQTGKDVDWQGETYRWSKHERWLRVLAVPVRTGRTIELALPGVDAASRAQLVDGGWTLAEANRVCGDPDAYRDYLRSSAGEFTVAKDQYVRFRTGWFSDRSACYLAAGRPVVTEDTGFPTSLPVGAGLFAFRTADEAVAALDRVHASPAGHAAAARELATEYFSPEKVLAPLLAAVLG